MRLRPAVELLCAIGAVSAAWMFASTASAQQFDDQRSRVRLWRDVPRSFFDLVRIRWNAARGRYDQPSFGVDSPEVQGAP